MSDKSKKAGKKYYKSLSESIAHMDRTEKMDDNYLLKPELQHLNISKYSKDVESKVRSMKEEHESYYKRKMPSNWKPYLDGLITFSATMTDDIKKYGREHLYKVVNDFLVEEFGDGLFGVSLHMDETTPHIHFHTVNYNTKEHKAYSAFMEKEIKDNNGSNPLQDRFADFLKSNIDGFEYKRGLTHSIKDYHNKRKYQQDHINKQDQVISQLESEIQNQQNELTMADEHIKQQEEMIKEKEQVIMDYEEKITSMSDEFDKAEKLLEESKDVLHNTIQDIVDELEKLGREEDGWQFMKLVKRYTNKDNKVKLNKLISKWDRALFDSLPKSSSKPR